ncbi:MAG: hypothetical protein HKP42_04585 [Maribacter sp.]|nr:hypothetical protein [Maribacter sp.]NND79906.1 hypothetical protein [Maribacter sp.]NNK18017.1 hypothetical protein [Maribacter sp.]NNK75322.1 hypothetical protein [Maribacter sp.]
MKTTFEILQTISPLDKKVILERLHNMRNIWNVKVEPKNRLISFEYLNAAVLKIIRKEINDMGLFVMNDTHHLDNSTKP